MIVSLGFYGWALFLFGNFYCQICNTSSLIIFQCWLFEWLKVGHCFRNYDILWYLLHAFPHFFFVQCCLGVRPLRTSRNKVRENVCLSCPAFLGFCSCSFWAILMRFSVVVPVVFLYKNYHGVWMKSWSYQTLQPIVMEDVQAGIAGVDNRIWFWDSAEFVILSSCSNISYFLTNCFGTLPEFVFWDDGDCNRQLDAPKLLQFILFAFNPSIEVY